MSMGFSTPEDLLLRILEGERPDQQDVVALAKVSGGESQFHEHKSGCFLAGWSNTKKKKKFNAEVVKQVCGFANAEGGIITWGVEDPVNTRSNRFEVKGCNDRLPDPEKTFGDVLTPIFASLFPAPKVLTVELKNGKPIYLVAVARAPNLVTLPGSEAPISYLRMGSSTRPVPTFLFADLIGGRRARPLLTPRDVIGYAHNESRGSVQTGDTAPTRFKLGLGIENNSFTTCEVSCQVAMPLSPHEGVEGQPVPLLVKRFIETSGEFEFLRGPAPQNIPPMAIGHFEIRLGEPGLYRIGHDVIKAAVAVRAEGHPPVWYQLTLSPQEQHSEGHRIGYWLDTGKWIGFSARLERTLARPTVAWEATD